MASPRSSALIRLRLVLLPECARSAADRYCSPPCPGKRRRTWDSPSYRHRGHRRANPAARQTEALLIFAALDVMSDALHVVLSVVVSARTAHRGQLPRLEYAAIAQNVELPATADNVRGCEQCT